MKKVIIAIIVILIILFIGIVFIVFHEFTNIGSFTKYSFLYDEVEFSRIKIGMKEKEVIDILGSPLQRLRLPTKQQFSIQEGKLYIYATGTIWADLTKDQVPVNIRRIFFNNQGKVEKIIKIDGDSYQDSKTYIGLIKQPIRIIDRSNNYIIKLNDYNDELNGLFKFGTDEKISSLSGIPNRIPISYYSYEKSLGLLYGRLQLSNEDNNLFFYDLNRNLLHIIGSGKISLADFMRNRGFNQYLFISTVDGVCLRDNDSLQGKIIRKLNKGEKLILVDIGREEDLRDSNGYEMKGSWLKCKAVYGEIGWCHDGYLQLSIL